MKYKNIIFDFGNVLASFQEDEMLSYFCDEADFDILRPAVFSDWDGLDAGILTLSECVEKALSKVPKRLKPNVIDYFDNWYKYLSPLTQTWDFIHELKERGYHIYILSNAPVQFAEHAPSCYPIVKEFDGIVFSAPIQLAKPGPEIYQYLFRKYNLKPEECFFIDDKPANIKAGQNLGMDGIIFTGDIDAVKTKIEFL